jgi:hypothetical protein
MPLLVQIRILNRRLDSLRFEMLLLVHTQSGEPDGLLRLYYSGVRKVLGSVVLLSSFGDALPVLILLRRTLRIHLVLGAFALDHVDLIYSPTTCSRSSSIRAIT